MKNSSSKLGWALMGILLSTPIACGLDQGGTGLFGPGGDGGSDGGTCCPPAGDSGGGSGGDTGSSGTGGGTADSGTADSGSCSPCPAICGNNNKEDPETCDGSDLSGKTCATVPGGYSGGTLKCKADCSGFDVTSCTMPITCGDTVCNGGETCSSCPADCGICPPACGNSVKEGSEVCDGTDFGGATCASIKGVGWTGTLTCKGNCTTIDSSACVPHCGNNAKEGAEICDGTDLSGLDCTTIPNGFSGGTLGCKLDCSNYDTSMCLLPATCNAGAAGTVDKIVASGTSQTGVLLHYALVADFYNTATTTKSFTGIKLPGQMVLAGKDGLNFSLFNGVVAQAKVWYKANMGDLPGAECGGVDGPKNQACLVKVAKSFRCQHGPYVEPSGCPIPAIGFTAQPAASTGSDATVGWQIVLADLTCP